MAPYTLIFIAVLIISPFAISLAERQDKKAKSHLKQIFLILLIGQTFLASFNWKTLLPFIIVSFFQINSLTF